MKNLFKNMDACKVVILASLVLTPVLAFFAYRWHRQVEVGRVALAAARQQLVQIGTYQKQIENQIRNSGPRMASDYRDFFAQQILNSATTGLERQDFIIGNKQETVMRQARAMDLSLDIEFKRDNKKFALPRDFLHAMFQRIESQSPWKLRELKLQNAEAADAVRSNKPPPPETGDSWMPTKIVFASREPAR